MTDVSDDSRHCDGASNKASIKQQNSLESTF